MKYALYCFLSIALPFASFGAAQDLRIQQRNSSNTAYVDRIFAPSGATEVSSVATFRTALGLGAGDSPTFLTPVVTSLALGATTPGTVGGTSGAVTIAAAGTNQNVSITPSGTGEVNLNTTAAGSYVQVGGRNFAYSEAALNALLSGSTAWTVRNAADSAYLLYITNAGNSLFGTPTDSSNGRVQVPSSSATTGLALGTRSAEVIYRTANDQLRTDSGWTVGGALFGTIQTLSGAGAVNVTQLTTAYTSTGGAQALTLADGAAGQLKTIVHDVDGGSGVLTPTTKTGFSTVTFTNAGDTVTLQFFTTRGWMVIGSYGATVAP